MAGPFALMPASCRPKGIGSGLAADAPRPVVQSTADGLSIYYIGSAGPSVVAGIKMGLNTCCGNDSQELAQFFDYLLEASNFTQRNCFLVIRHSGCLPNDRSSINHELRAKNDIWERSFR